MTGFVPEDAHARSGRAPFDLEHLSSFESHQSGVCEIKRNGDSRDAVRGKPLAREPDVRLETDPTRFEFAVESLNVAFDRGSLDG